MSEFTVAAIRFTENIDAMRTFLADLGLEPAITADGWADMRAGRGAVWLHSLASATTASVSGSTCLAGEVDDLDALAERLAEAGLAPAVVDEAFGRSLTVIDPLGDEVGVNERQTDTYGYETHDARPDERLTVSPVRFADPQGPYGEFLQQLGLHPVGHADEWFAAYEADGQVGLHHDEGSEKYLANDSGPQVNLGFVTTEDLDELAKRLEAKGHSATITRDEFVSFVETTDPDGMLVQIHAANGGE